jgi:APA family basic amino acid/polyamine antiporter
MGTSTGPKIFAREATGLVREYGLWMAFVVSVTCINIGLNIPQLYYSTPALLPGVDVGLMLTIELIPVFFWATAFSMMSAAFPRSGGDYVWGARSLGGLGGFIIGWGWITIYTIASAYNADIVPSFILSQALTIQGILTNNSALMDMGAWLATPVGIMVAGSLMLILASIVLIVGGKVFRLVMTILLILGFAGIFAMAGAIAATSHSTFIQLFNTAFGGGNSSYENVMRLASQQGISSSFSLAATLLALPFGIIIYGGLHNAAYVAGETKNARTNTPIAIAITVIACWAFMTGLWYLMVNTFGVDFITAIGGLAFMSPNLYPLPVPPTMNLFGALVANNAMLAGFIGIGFAAWGFLVMPSTFLTMSRVMFAMSFDRVLPTKLADINDRTHTPVFAVIVCLIATIAVLYLFSFTSMVQITAAVGMSFGMLLSITGLAVMVLPFTKPALLEQAPGWVKMKFGPVPFATIVGIGLTVFMIVEAYFGWITDNAPRANVAIAGILLSGIPLYLVARWYRKSKDGIDISLVFKEIPPE